MDQEEIQKNDRDFMKVISLFLLLFSFLVFIAVFLSKGTSAKITNLVCSILLVVVALIFYSGSKKKKD